MLLHAESRCFGPAVKVPCFLTPHHPSFCRSMYNFFMNIVSAKKGDVDDVSNVSTTSEDDSKPLSPKTETPADGDVDMTSYSPTSTASSSGEGESWARGMFEKRRQHRQQRAGVGGGGNVETSPPNGPDDGPAAPGAAPVELGEASGFAGAFSSSVGNERHPRHTQAGSAFGVRAVSAGSFTASTSSVSSGVSNNNSVGPVVEAGAAAGSVATAAPTAPASATASATALATATATAEPPPPSVVGQSVGRSPDQRRGDGAAPVPLFQPLPSARSSANVAAPARAAEACGKGDGDGDGGLELLDAAELEGAEGAGLLDAVDALLGEAVLEGFGEGGDEEDMLPFFSGNV